MNAWRYLACLLLLSALAGAQERVTVYSLANRGERTGNLADAATRGIANGLTSLPEVTCSVVRDTPEAEGAHRAMSAGELGQRLATATGATLVVLGVVTRPASAPDTVLLSGCAYDATRGDVLLAETVRLEQPDGYVGAGELQRAATDWLVRSYRHWRAPEGAVAEVTADAAHQLTRVHLPTGVASSPDGYQVLKRSDALTSPTTGERFSAVPELVGSGKMVRSEGESTWLELPLQPAVAVGTTLVVNPAGDPVPAPTGPGVVVSSRPWGAVVAVDGRVLGATPLWIPLPATGEAMLELTHPDTLPWRRPVSAAAAASRLLPVSLNGAAPAVTPGRAASLVVESIPPGAEVLVDGVLRGVTPLRLEGVQGRPVVTVRRDGYEPWEGQVQANGVTTVRAELQPSYGGLEVTSTPPGAELSIDGQLQGTTPLRLTGVPAGQHEIKVVTKGRPAVVRQVMVPAGQVERLTVDLIRGTAVASRTPGAAAPAPATGGSTGTATTTPPRGPATPPLPAPAAPGATTPAPVPGPTPAPAPATGATPPLPAVTPPTPAPAPKSTLASRALDIRDTVWQQKVKLATGTLNLVVARLDEGLLVSLTMSPSKPSAAEVTTRSVRIGYEKASKGEKVAWAVTGLKELEGIAVSPNPEHAGQLDVRLRLGPDTLAAVHDTSTPERMRVILVHPTAG